MSDSLQDVDHAIQRYIAEAFPGELVDSWVLVTHSTGLEDDNHDIHNYRLTEAAESQAWHTTAGLVRAAVNISRDSWDYDGEDD